MNEAYARTRKRATPPKAFGLYQCACASTRRAINAEPHADGSDGAAGVSASSDGGSPQSALTVALAVAIPCGVALLLFGVMLMIWRRRREQAHSPGRRGAKGAAPGAHPSTTLVVTDM
jgi:hypothetical protein